MKVKDVLEKLSQLDPELDVLCYSEEESLVAKGHEFRLMDVESIGTITGEKCRCDDNVPSMKIGESEYSQQHVTLNVIGVF